MTGQNPEPGISTIVVFRPGALGDVLVVRTLLCWLKDVFPHAKTTLVAPGRRAELLVQPGLADAWRDWEGGAFSWLFSADPSSEPPEALPSLFPERTLVFAYLDLDGDRACAFQQRLARIGRSLFISLSSSRPDSGERLFIGSWLVRNAARFCEERGLVGIGRGEGGAERLILVPETKPDGGVLVMHPGSGSAGKNWPLDRFVAIGKRLRHECSDIIRQVCVTSGEADGELGVRLAEALPGAVHLHCPELRELACNLGNARLYLGNDSGVSHLAASVQTTGGRRPTVGILFGPSDARIWGQPDALVFRNGPGWDELTLSDVYSRLRQRLFSAPVGESIQG